MQRETLSHVYVINWEPLAKNQGADRTEVYSYLKVKGLKRIIRPRMPSRPVNLRREVLTSVRASNVHQLLSLCQYRSLCMQRVLWEISFVLEKGLWTLSEADSVTRWPFTKALGWRNELPTLPKSSSFGHRLRGCDPISRFNKSVIARVIL
jgi:hypothetical protein